MFDGLQSVIILGGVRDSVIIQIDDFLVSATLSKEFDVQAEIVFILRLVCGCCSCSCRCCSLYGGQLTDVFVEHWPTMRSQVTREHTCDNAWFHNVFNLRPHLLKSIVHVIRLITSRKYFSNVELSITGFKLHQMRQSFTVIIDFRSCATCRFSCLAQLP